MAESLELGRLEGWLREVITHPEGPAEGAASAAARCHLEVSADQLQLVIGSSARLNAAQRLALYQRSYHLRLLEAIRAPYPGLRHMLGSELFDDFALEYIHARPSRSYTLQALASGLATYLSDARPDAGAETQSWIDLMIDLARLEVIVADVYDAHGAEGKPVLSANALPGVADPRLLGCMVEPVECLRLVRSSFAVGPYLSAIRRGEDPPLPPTGESFLAVSRRDYVVTLAVLEARDYDLLDRLVHGVPIGRAAAGARIGRSAAWRLVRQWADSGCFLSLRPASPGGSLPGPLTSHPHLEREECRTP